MPNMKRGRDVIVMKAPIECLEQIGTGYTLSALKENDIIHIVAEGEVSPVSMRGLFAGVTALCRTGDCQKIICESVLVGFSSFEDIRVMRAGLLSCDIPQEVEMAVVCPPEYFWAYHYLGENVQLNTGATTRIFRDLQEAREWLNRS